MKKVFLDSSVLVAASASLTGASAYVLGFSRQKKLKCYITLDVIGEARHNINLKLGDQARKRLIFFLKFAHIQRASMPTIEMIVQTEKYINAKDAPILAAAKESSVQFFLTLDKKHFLNQKIKEIAKPLQIMTPGDFVQQILKKNK